METAAAPLPLDILDSIGEPVVLVDHAWRITWANQQAILISRMTAAQLSSDSIWTLFPELTGTPVWDACHRTMAQRAFEIATGYYAPYDLWFELKASPAPSGIVLFVRDVSERIRAEEHTQQLTRALNLRVKEMETLLDVLPVGIGLARDPNCLDIKVNSAFASLLGTDPAMNASKSGPEADGLPFRVFRDGVELPGDQLPMQTAAREAREVRDMELDLMRADGSIITELCLARPLFDEQQKVRGSIGVFLDITDRKRVEEALRESEKRYRFLAEGLPQIVWIATPENRIIYINDYWCAYTGLTLEQTQQGGWSALIHPDDLTEVVGRATAARASGGQYEAEYRLRRASDGAYRWHFARSRIVLMADGTERWLGTAIDIDDRRRIEREREELLEREQALRKQAEDSLALQMEIENRLLLLVEASGALIASPESEQVLTTILELARRFVGADAYGVWWRDGDGMRWDLLASDGLSESYEKSITQTAGAANPVPEQPFAVDDVEQEVTLRHRMALYRAEGIRSMLTVPLRINGRVAGTITLYYRVPHKFTDLETRVAGGLANLAAAALGTAELYERQSHLRRQAEFAEQRARLLSEAGKVLSSSLDFESTLATVAELAVPQFADWACVDILDDTGVPRRVAIKHQNREKVARGFEHARRFPHPALGSIMRALRTGESILQEEVLDSVLVERVAHPEQLGYLRALGLTSAIIVPLQAHGSILGTLLFATAESGRRYTAADLAIAEELAGRAATAVANARLFSASKAAELALQKTNAELERANADLNQFAWSASHDLREPLRMVSIFSEMLAVSCAGVLPPEAHEYIHYLIQGAARMEALVKDILTYTESANFSGETIAGTSAADALRKALSYLEVSIRESGALIEAGALPVLAVHDVHLVQIFQNVIGNAIKYRGTAEPRIAVSADRQEDGNWRISVRDNGIGIAPEYFAQIFRLFKRLHTAAQYSGTGLGLAICQKIVERYGGRIWVQSQPGCGATFCFTLPDFSPPG